MIISPVNVWALHCCMTSDPALQPAVHIGWKYSDQTSDKKISLTVWMWWIYTIEYRWSLIYTIDYRDIHTLKVGGWCLLIMCMDGVCMTQPVLQRPRCCLRPEPDILGSAAVSGGVACTLHTELSPDIPSKQRESGSIIRHQTVVSLSDITLSRGQIREQRQNTGQSGDFMSRDKECTRIFTVM